MARQPADSETATAATKYRYQVLRDELARQIRAGELRPGDRLPTFVQMRHDYGVMPATVHRAYAALAEAGLIERRQGSGVYVADGAPARARGDTRRLVVGMTAARSDEELQKHYWTALMNGVVDGASDHHLVMVEPRPDAFVEYDWLDGLLLANPHGREWVHEGAVNLPCVSMLYPIDEVDSVVADDFGGTQALTEHLLYLGHRRIAFVTLGGPDIAAHRDGPMRRRRRGFERALRAAGIPADQHCIREMSTLPDVVGAAHEEAAYQGMRQWLAQTGDEGWAAQRPTGIVALNDSMAVGVIEALQEAGYRVPEDVSVTGFDGLAWSRYFRPRLTTAEVPLDEIGRRASERLQTRIDEPDAPIEHSIQPVQIRARGSTGPCPPT